MGSEQGPLQTVVLCKGMFGEGGWRETDSGIDDFPQILWDNIQEKWESSCSTEMETEEEDHSNLFSEIVEANQEVAKAQMNFNVADKYILQVLTTGDALSIPPPSKQITTQKVGLQRKRNEEKSNEEPTVKRIKGENNEETRQRIEYTLVMDKNTNKNRLINFKKNEKIPSNYEVASADILKLHPDRQDHFTIIPRASGMSVVKVSPSALEQMSRSSLSATKTSHRLISLSDLMTSGIGKNTVPTNMQKKASAPLVSPIRNSGNQETNKILLSQLKNDETPAVSSSEAEPLPELSIVKVCTSPRPQKQSLNNPGNLVMTSSIATSKPSLTVTPLGQSQITTRVGRSFGSKVLFCKICGEAYPCHSDNLFRKHMFFRHSLEILDDKYFTDNQLYPQQLLKCKKCNAVLASKFEEHRMVCLPTLTKEAAFEEISSLKNVHHVCSIGECRVVFGMRSELKNHLLKEHENVAQKMIVDPDFRCSKCLKLFNDAFALGKHCMSCNDLHPSKETILELSRSLLYCDTCEKEHEGLSDSTSCYLEKKIFRCVLCLAVFKEKSLFYKHLLTYHGLATRGQPKLLIDCPMCSIGPDKYCVVFPHIVTEHFVPILSSSTPHTHTSSMSIQKNARTPDLVRNQTSQVAVGRSTVPGITSARSSFAPSKKIPELRPLPRLVATTGGSNSTPILINTNRLIPTATTTNTTFQRPALMMSSSTHVYTQNQVVMRNNTSSLSVSRSVPTVRPGQVIVSPSSPVYIRPNMPGNNSPSLSQHSNRPLYILSPSTASPHTARQVQVIARPQVGLVRPLPPSVPLNSQVSTAPQLLVSSITSSNMNSGGSSTSSAAIPSTSGPASTSSSSRLTISHTATVAGSMTRFPAASGATTSVIRGPMTSGTVTFAQGISRASGSLPVAASSVPVSAVPSIRHTTVSATNASAPTSNVQGNTSSNPSTVTTGNNNVTPKLVTSLKPTTSASKPGTRIVTIGGREFEVIQKKLEKSQTITQSASGLTVVRHSLPNASFKTPFVPSAISALTVRPTIPQQPAAIRNPLSQNPSSTSS